MPYLFDGQATQSPYSSTLQSDCSSSPSESDDEVYKTVPAARYERYDKVTQDTWSFKSEIESHKNRSKTSTPVSTPQDSLQAHEFQGETASKYSPPAPSSKEATCNNIDLITDPDRVERTNITNDSEYEEYVKPPVRLNSWTPRQKETVCILRRWYTNDWTEISLVFGYIFSEQLRYCGYEYGMKGNIIEACFYNMGTARNVAYKTVYRTDFYDAQCVFDNRKGKLEAAAAEIGVGLNKRDRECASTLAKFRELSRGKRKRRETGFTDDSNTEDDSPDDDQQAQDIENEETTCETRVPARISRQKKKAILYARSREEANSLVRSLAATTAINFSSTKLSQEYRVPSPGSVPNLNPRVLFRCYNNKSQGHNSSTLFRSGATYLPPIAPPIFSQDCFRSVQSHIWRRLTPSPWISTTTSLIWVLHKASVCLALDWDGPPHIAVIDASKIPSTNLYHTRVLTKEMKVQGYDLPPRYQGAFEYFIWNEIPQNAILNTLTLADFNAAQHHASFLHLDIVPKCKNVKNARSELKRFACDQSEEELQKQIEGFGAFLLGEGNSSQELIQCISSSVVQNWSLNELLQSGE